MLSDEDMHERMVRGWRAGRPETECGNGSTLSSTEKIRAWLPEIVEQYNIFSINDAGAGDLHWIKRVQWGRPIAYRAFDLIPRDDSIASIDITTQALPHADAILCRMVLNHLDDARIGMAIELFRKRSRFLIATQFDGENMPKRSPQFTRCDLRTWLGDPLQDCADGHEKECRLALWSI